MLAGEATAESIEAFVAAQRKSVLTFTGYSGAGYEHPQRIQERATAILNERDHGNTLINIGATGVGIGALYPIARDLGFTTMGVVSTLARDEQVRLSNCVDHVFYVADRHWGGRGASGELTPTSATLVAISDSFVAFGGGDVSKEELLAAREAGKPVTFIPADMNHRTARQRAREHDLPEPTDFRGSAHHALI
jgi:hypothetical protein